MTGQYLLKACIILHKIISDAKSPLLYKSDVIFRLKLYKIYSNLPSVF